MRFIFHLCIQHIEYKIHYILSAWDQEQDQHISPKKKQDHFLNSVGFIHNLLTETTFYGATRVHHCLGTQDSCVFCVSLDWRSSQVVQPSSLDNVLFTVCSVCSVLSFSLHLCLCLCSLPDVLGRQRDRDPGSAPLLDAATPAAHHP